VVLQLLLDAAPATASAATSGGLLPLHCAAERGDETVAQLLLAAAPAAAMQADTAGLLPLHGAASRGHTTVAQLLLAAAPESVRAVTAAGLSPLECALGGLAQGRSGCEAVARCLAAVTPAHAALAALASAGAPALPLIADCVAAHLPLSNAGWQLVPAPCPGLGRSFPAALDFSAAQAAQMVPHLTPA